MSPIPTLPGGPAVLRPLVARPPRARRRLLAALLRSPEVGRDLRRSVWRRDARHGFFDHRFRRRLESGAGGGASGLDAQLDRSPIRAAFRARSVWIRRVLEREQRAGWSSGAARRVLVIDGGGEQGPVEAVCARACAGDRFRLVWLDRDRENVERIRRLARAAGCERVLAARQAGPAELARAGRRARSRGFDAVVAPFLLDFEVLAARLAAVLRTLIGWTAPGGVLHLARLADPGESDRVLFEGLLGLPLRSGAGGRKAEEELARSGLEVERHPRGPNLWYRARRPGSADRR